MQRPYIHSVTKRIVSIVGGGRATTHVSDQLRRAADWLDANYPGDDYEIVSSIEWEDDSESGRCWLRIGFVTDYASEDD